VAVGEIVAAHALRGVVRVRPYQPPAPSLAAGRTVLLEHDGSRRPVRIDAVTPHGRDALLVELAGVGDRTAAERLRGARLLVARDDLPPAGDGEFYWHEIVGFAVETDAGEALGAIVETLHTGANDVWVVRDGQREHLIPVIADVVRTIDRDGRRVVISPMPGLLD